MEDSTLWPVLLASALAVVLSVILHAAVVVKLKMWGDDTSWSPVAILSTTVLVLITAHLFQIGVFTSCHYLAEFVGRDRIGELAGDTNGSMFDRYYFSAVVFSTLGFGDIRPLGPLRILYAVQALCGLVLIAWSASLTYHQLQEHFKSVLGPTESKK
ncbi:ion channel [Mucisphaera sp.]|uniref:ion channel n=1 Tax=Mucisphaera sp. TaxID=2913024 RepID=UPI003D11493C